MSSILRAFEGDPKYKGISVIKDKPLQGQINTLSGDYNALRTQGQDSLSDFISKYLAGTANAERYAGQETQAIDPFFNGGYAANLGLLRGNEAAAREAAGQRYSMEALNALKRGSVANDGGPGSWGTRYLTNVMSGIGVDNATRDAAQARADYEASTRAPLALAGARTGIADTLAQRSLVPYQASSGMFGQNEDFLNKLAGLVHGNATYGVQAKKGTLGQIADIIDGITGQLSNDASMYSSMIGGGARGGGGGGSSL